MSRVFRASFATRHTDTFAATGFVHAGILLGLTELAYAGFEQHCGITKPAHVVAVQTATEARYASPLRWQEGAEIEVATTSANARTFRQEFRVSSAADGRLIATIAHDWVWLDTTTGRAAAIPDDVQERFLKG